MGTFVIVHGAWGGGWEWSGVARRLRGRGHEVLTPTLTGMGERAHAAPDAVVGLGTHVQDIVEVLTFEDLHDVVLCGASYGGMPVTGAADRTADRIRVVVYVDALLPRDGQSALDLLPDDFEATVRSGLEAHGPAWRVPMPPGLRDALIPPGSIPDGARSWYLDRVRDHPAASFAEPVQLTGAVDRVRRAFVRCTTSEIDEELGGDPIEACAARARAEGWPYRELATPHDPQIFDPAGIAELIDELAEAR